MRRGTKAVLAILLVLGLTLAVAACGSDSAPKIAATAKIAVKSPGMVGDRLPVRYTCDGQDISPPVEWGAVPTDVKELALFVIGFTPNLVKKTYHVTVEWAVAGLNPSLHRLAAGRLPPQAFLGIPSSGKSKSYSICPAKGTSVHYQVELYGVPAKSTPPRPPRHFFGAALLNLLTLPSGPTRNNAHGGFVANYKRS